MNKDLSSLYTARRSIYNLGSRQILREEEISTVISHALKFCPSAFNSQSARLVVLFGKHYRKLWDIVLTELSKVVPEDKMPATIEKIQSFSNGLGTVLFFEDTHTVENLKNKFPLYAENFPKWSLESNGMLQYMIWLALAEKNIGASLQHYNPLIDNEVKLTFDIPAHWQLLAQMPFGSIEQPADEKSFLPLEERLKIFR